MTTATTSARDVIKRYRGDPVAFSREVLRFDPWSKQREILESARDHTRTAVRSCHAAGKTATAARAAVWFLAVHPHSKVITTAPTWAQVRDLLWREIRLGHAASDGFVGGELFDTRLELDWAGRRGDAGNRPDAGLLPGTERRRSRTYPAWGCHASPVLKTGWATGPMPLHCEPSPVRRGRCALHRPPRPARPLPDG